jgi:hypothetical protein
MLEPAAWNLESPQQRRAQYEAMISEGRALDVSHRAPGCFRKQQIAIETRTFDRFVAWGGASRRHYGMDLDEGERLASLLDASACAAISTGGCFICRAIDSEGSDRNAQRHVLTMSNMGQPTAPIWLIHE